MKTKQINAAAAMLGSAGGRAGRGESKRRPPEHYRRIAALSHEAKAKNKKKTKKGGKNA